MIEFERRQREGAPGWVRRKEYVDYVLAWALVVLMGGSVVNVLWQVATRFVLGDPSAFTDELARYLLIWIGLLGGAYAVGKQLHLAIDLLPMRLAGRPGGSVLTIVIKSVVFLFALFVLVLGGGRLVYIVTVLGQTSAALGVPLGVVYLVLPLSGLLIMYYTSTFIYEHVRLVRGRPVALPEASQTSAEALQQQHASDPPEAQTGA
jgi:TRAP-type C4-dicarboxylate transport system permease small subunit